MLTLKFQTEPYWIDLIEGLRLKVRPFSSVILEQARDGIAEQVTDQTGPRERYTLLTIAVAKLVVLDWEGVNTEDGQPVPVTTDAVEFALHFPLVSQLFQESYMAAALQMGFEKKGFAPLPSGISGGAQDTAMDVSPSMESDVQGQSESPAQQQ